MVEKGITVENKKLRMRINKSENVLITKSRSYKGSNLNPRNLSNHITKKHVMAQDSRMESLVWNSYSKSIAILNAIIFMTYWMTNWRNSKGSSTTLENPSKSRIFSKGQTRQNLNWALQPAATPYNKKILWQNESIATTASPIHWY